MNKSRERRNDSMRGKEKQGRSNMKGIAERRKERQERKKGRKRKT